MKGKKQGFSSPLPYIIADELKLLYKIFLNDSHLVEAGYLKQEGIDMLLQQHLNKKVDHGTRLWLLCNAEIWYRMYIENESKATIKNILSNHKSISYNTLKTTN